MAWGKTDVFELVFERVPGMEAIALCSKIGSISTVLPSAEQGVDDVAVDSLALSSTVIVHRVHVRVLYLDCDLYDVEMNFQFGDASVSSEKDLFEALYNFAADLASSHGLSAYYAGLEPASDTDTRLFTGFARGPLLSSL